MASKPLTIVVGGYIIAYPLGGMTWHHLNYLLGLHELGHEVWFLEDSDSYSYPYNPTTWQSSADSTYGRAYLERTFAEYGLPLRYCYYSQFEDKHYGLNRQELASLLQRADLFLSVSGITPMHDAMTGLARVARAVIDTDPVFTQLRMSADPKFVEYYRRFDAVATFGRLIGTPASPLPTHGFNWIATNQPIAMRHWPVVPPTSRAFTTIGKWEHSTDRNFEFNGQRYQSSKGVEWLKMLDLPRRVQWDMTMGMLAMPGQTAEKFAQHGWKLVNPEQATLSCRSFADFLRSSAGEFTVAKQIYAGLPSGWFSDRGAAYLASGRPVVTQGSGFDQWLPVGEGLFSIGTLEQAADALNSIGENYSHHSASARRIAEEYFNSRTVLTALLDKIL